MVSGNTTAKAAFAVISPVTCVCDAWRLEAAASYIEADVSAGLWQLVTAGSYIEADVSAGLWQLVTAASYIEADVSASCQL